MRVAAHRLRARYREMLREEVGRTTDNQASIDEEIADLLAALARRTDRISVTPFEIFFSLNNEGES